MAAFAELGVMGEIIRALEGIGWMLPTPIQQEAIPQGRLLSLTLM